MQHKRPTACHASDVGHVDSPTSKNAKQKNRRTVTWIVLGLLAGHAGLLAYGAAVHSPTYNEPAHLAAGVSYWKFGRFDLYSVNPPLVRMLAAAPVMMAGCKTDWRSFSEGTAARPEMTIGNDFCIANGLRTFWLITLSRWACIPFSLLGGVICFLWGRQLYGAAAGMLSLTLWCFGPNILAHGQLITCDMAATAMGAAACYTFWNWLRLPTWRNCAISGIVLGLAQLTKTTLLIFYPLWAFLWLVYRCFNKRTITTRVRFREFAMMCTLVLISMNIINLGYGFEGSLTQLGDFTFVSRTLTGIALDEQDRAPGNRFKGTWLGILPIPLPKNYVLGIDLQRKDFESYGHDFYLGGEWSKAGWWYYYLFALAIKVPLGNWVLLFLATIARLWMTPNVNFREELVLLAPAVVILAFVSSQTGINEHIRYVLPVFPFFIIWIGRIVPARALCRYPNELARLYIPTALAAVGLTWTIISSICIYPHSLSYFNEFAGGPRGGPRELIFGNIDWGQDLLFLKKWCEEHSNSQPLTLAYFGPCAVRTLGIEANDYVYCLKSNAPDQSTEHVPPGWYAISVNLLRGYRWKFYTQEAFADFQKLEPEYLAGYSIYVYHVPKPVQRVP